MLMLYGTFILLTLLAIVVEFAVKYAYAAVIYADIVKYADAVYRTEGNAIGIGIRKTLDDQSTYCWLLPIIFRVVPAIGRSSLEQYLRWLPYLFQILLPAVYWFLAAQKERNWHTVVWCIPIIFSIYQGIGCILAANYLPYLRISHYHGIPFFLEACLLVWLGVALRKKKPKMRKACGIILLVFCALSPFVSWLLEVLLYRLESPLSFIFSSHIFYDFPRIARSCWPVVQNVYDADVCSDCLLPASADGSLASQQNKKDYHPTIDSIILLGSLQAESKEWRKIKCSRTLAGKSKDWQRSFVS